MKTEMHIPLLSVHDIYDIHFGLKMLESILKGSIQRRVWNDVIWSVVQICLKSDLAKFLKNFQGKAFCKKAWQWRDSNWGLPGDSPESLPLYQHNVL